MHNDERNCHYCNQRGHIRKECPKRGSKKQQPGKAKKPANPAVARGAFASRAGARAHKKKSAVTESVAVCYEQLRGECDALREQLAEVEDRRNIAIAMDHQRRQQDQGPEPPAEGAAPPPAPGEVQEEVRPPAPPPPPPPAALTDWWTHPDNVSMADWARGWEFAWHENLAAFLTVRGFVNLVSILTSFIVALLIAPGFFLVLRGMLLSFIFLTAFRILQLFIQRHGVYYWGVLFRTWTDSLKKAFQLSFAHYRPFVFFVRPQVNIDFFGVQYPNATESWIGAIYLSINLLLLCLASFFSSSFLYFQLAAISDIWSGSWSGCYAVVSSLLRWVFLTLRLCAPAVHSWISPFVSGAATTVVAGYIATGAALIVISWWFLGLWQVGMLAYQSMVLRRAKFLRFKASRLTQDQRAFTFRNQTLEDQECPFVVLVSYEIFGFVIESFETDVSASLMAELTSHKYNRPGSNLDDTKERIYRACATTGSMNIDRYGFFQNIDLAGETARLSFAWVKHRNEKVLSWGRDF